MPLARLLTLPARPLKLARKKKARSNHLGQAIAQVVTAKGRRFPAAFSFGIRQLRVCFVLAFTPPLRGMFANARRFHHEETRMNAKLLVALTAAVLALSACHQNQSTQDEAAEAAAAANNAADASATAAQESAEAAAAATDAAAERAGAAMDNAADATANAAQDAAAGAAAATADAAQATANAAQNVAEKADAAAEKAEQEAAERK
ncbi:MAG TPA: hypothetical protein VFE83_18870 [Lysobacter sp.]|nr:hypothetical protein [Lysobacter sp.]